MNRYTENDGGRPERAQRGKPARTPRGEKPDSAKKPKKERPGRLTRQQKLLLGVAIALAVVLVITLVIKSLFVRPELNKPASGPDSSAEEIDYGDGTRPRSDGVRKSKDFYTILVMGRDTGGGGNTDTMLLASYDVTNQKLTVMNIPRDTMVNVSWDIKRINSVYNTYGRGEKGIQAVYKEVSQLVGFEPDYQVIVEWDAVGKLVDAIGGVYFDVPRNMNYDDPYQDLSIHIDKGYQLLDGESAMGVIRYRHDNNMRYGYPDGDLGRIKTQQAFLKAVLQQLLQVKNLGKINQFAKIFEENVETDLTVQNLFWFGKSAIMGGLSMDNVNFVTMPNTAVSCWSRSYKNNQSYVTPNAKELLDLVNNHLSPFVETFTLSDLDIMSVNSDGSVSSTTGHVEDAKAAVPPVKDSGTKPDSSESGGTPEIDPETGYIVDPETGMLIDPETGNVMGGGSAGTVINPDGSVTNPDGTTTFPGGSTSAPGASGGSTSTPGASGGTTTTPPGGSVTPPDNSGGTSTAPPDNSGGTSATTPETPGGTAEEPVPPTDPSAGTSTGEPTVPTESADPNAGDSPFSVIDPNSGLAA